MRKLKNTEIIKKKKRKKKQKEKFAQSHTASKSGFMFRIMQFEVLTMLILPPTNKSIFILSFSAVKKWVLSLLLAKGRFPPVPLVTSSRNVLFYLVLFYQSFQSQCLLPYRLLKLLKFEPPDPCTYSKHRLFMLE